MSPQKRADLYAAFVRDLFYQGNNFNVHRPILRVFGKLDGLLLCDLLNRGCSPSAPTDPDGFFLCTQDYLADETTLGWSRKEQELHLGRLRKTGVVQTKLAGVGAKRWVRIDLDRLAKTMTQQRLPRKPDGKTRQNLVDMYGNSPPKGGSKVPPKGGSNKNKGNKETLSVAPSPPAAAAATPDDEEGEDVFDGMGLVTNQSPATPKVSPAPVDYLWAVKLQEALARRLKMTRPWSKGKWATEFTRLRDSLREDTDRLERVLDWYLDNVGNEYVPEAYSAAAFRSKFDRIESQMVKRLADAPLPLSPEAKAVLEKVDHLVWPKGAKSGLPNMVQKSLDNYAAFGGRLKALSAQREIALKSSPVHSDRKNWLVMLALHGRMCRSFLGGNVSTIRAWVEEVHQQLADWEDWSGSLKGWHWSLTNKLVIKQIETAAGGYPKAWAEYRKELGV